MSALKSVALALDMALRHRDAAAKALLQIQHNCRGAQDQMEQLENYAAQTESKWALSAQVCVTAQTIQHYYQFMGRLQQAIALQGNAVTSLNTEWMAAKARLLEAEIRIASLNRLLEKNRLASVKLQAGREQKQLDEFAAAQYRRLRSGLDTLETP